MKRAEAIRICKGDDTVLQQSVELGLQAMNVEPQAERRSRRVQARIEAANAALSDDDEKAEDVDVGDPCQSAFWQAFVQQSVQPAFDRAEQKLGEDNAETDVLEFQMKGLRAASLFDPPQFIEWAKNGRDHIPHAWQPTGTMLSVLDDLAFFPFISLDTIDKLKEEAVAFARCVAKVHCKDDAGTLLFYYQLRQDREVRTWHDVFLKMAVLTATSASIERLFSVLEQAFHTTQSLALREYVEGVLMLRFNNL